MTLSSHSPAAILIRAAAIILMSGLVGATLVRISPGFGVDERLLDPRLAARTMEALEREHAAERNPLTFYVSFLGRVFRGDLGRSEVFGQPVALLIGERAPATIRTVAAGLTLAWLSAFSLAAAAALRRKAGTVLVAAAIGGVLLSVPSAVLATVCVVLRLPAAAAIAAVVFPRVFPNIYEQLRASLAKPHVIMARARGLSGVRVFLFHVVPAAVMPLFALAGVSLTLAFGAAIPIEALADSPGLGQLAWRAALGRDVPVLVGVTLLLATVTVSANAVADIAISRSEHPS